MVYRGRPSKGCLHCRNRRIKVLYPKSGSDPTFNPSFQPSYLTFVSVIYQDLHAVSALDPDANVPATEMKSSSISTMKVRMFRTGFEVVPSSIAHKYHRNPSQ